MTDFDFTSVTAERAELPKRTVVKDKKDNPFVPILSESYAAKEGRKITVPAAHSAEAMKLIRYAAQALGIGVRIVVTDLKNIKLTKEVLETYAGTKNAKVHVLFEGQEKRAYTERKKKDTAESPATPATV